MQQGSRSRTAEAAAFQRAAHLVLDDPPFVLEDYEIESLLRPSLRFLLKHPAGLTRAVNGMGRGISPAVAQLRGQIIVRSRYTEDKLRQQLANGVTQYVILSAGLDTFALRSKATAESLRIFEVDQHDTQLWKRRLLESKMPDNLHFIAVDFEKQSIGDALAGSQFDTGAPAFFSWLGTTYYLSNEAIFDSLRSVLETAASGSQLVLDYWSRAPKANWRSKLLLKGVRLIVASQKEPMLSFFMPKEIERAVRDIGFEVIENFRPDAARKTYLANRFDQLDVPDFGYLLHLRVP